MFLVYVLRGAVLLASVCREKESGRDVVVLMAVAVDSTSRRRNGSGREEGIEDMNPDGSGGGRGDAMTNGAKLWGRALNGSVREREGEERERAKGWRTVIFEIPGVRCDVFG